MNIQKLWNKNFTLMIIGQIISLFGNAILRFSLSLYVLQETGSATIFASILAISILPTIFLSPVGGMLADRMSRKYIMVILDTFTGSLIIAFAFLMQYQASIIWIGAVMILLSIIQAFYQPSVQASIPLLATQEHLLQANGIAVQVNALASLAGPILAGFLFSFLPFTWLLAITSICFLFSAILECIMHIPFQKTITNGSLLQTATSDIKAGMRFIFKEQPILCKLLFILALLNLVLSSLMTVGLPVISNIILKLDATYYGWLEASVGIGSIIGSLFIPFAQKKYNIQKAYIFLLFASLALIPITIALIFPNQAYLAYALVMLGSVLAMAFATIFNIYTQTYLQQATPNELLGKVSSFITMIVMCAYPIGQSIYGILFDSFSTFSFFILAGACVLSILISIRTRHAFSQLT